MSSSNDNIYQDQSADASSIEVPENFDPVAYINSTDWRTSRMGMDRIVELMHRLGDPQDSMHVVHAAGTNGKGSTCAFIASILQEAGYTTGLFTSPFIIRFADRIHVNGVEISKDDLMRATLEVRAQAEQMDDHPTEFEMMCAVALVHFRNKGVEFAVLETGLGGLLDATNVVEHPQVCVMTPISFDHMAILGNTLHAIAWQKAGIIKPGAEVVSSPQDEEVIPVFREQCRKTHCPLTFVDEDAVEGYPLDFSYKQYKHIKLHLMGSYQIENAATAIEAVEALRRQHVKITDQQVRDGLEKTQWIGRFQIVAHNPTTIIDGGHNPQGAHVLVQSIKQTFPDQKAVFCLGILADKDYLKVIDELIPYAQQFVCITPPNPRALEACDLADVIRHEGEDFVSCEACENPVVADSIYEGMERARGIAGRNGLVVGCGSLYSIAEMIDALSKQFVLDRNAEKSDTPRADIESSAVNNSDNGIQ